VILIRNGKMDLFYRLKIPRAAAAAPGTLN
jgi:hypothetical protein